MKHFAVVSALLLLLALPLLAQQTTGVVRTLPPSPQLLIPAAGSVAGANGTFFKSDINLVNFASHDQRVRMQWLPQNVGGASIAPVEITLAAGSGIVSNDFVGAFLQQSGLGSILITGITATGTVDATAQLYATARIWTPQPGTDGTTSQSFPVIVTTDIAATRQYIFGMRRDNQYRMAVGVVNLSSLTQRFTVTSTAANSTQVLTDSFEVPALSMQQVGIFGNTTGPFQLIIENTTTTTRSNQWQSYATTTDNVTGDSWNELGFNQP